MTVTIVTTTIHMPVLIEDYCENARAFGHDEVNFIIIGDVKTPPEVADFSTRLARKYRYEILYYDVERQLDYLGRFPELADHLPLNSIQRRNIGLLMAYEMGSEVIVTIDDDNFVTEDDFVGSHAEVGTTKERECVSSDSGWYNVCQMLIEEEGRPFFHRGFPMGQRWQTHSVTREKRRARVTVNAGLWLNDPDIDAITRMDMPIRALALRPEYHNGVTLAAGTWCPFNSQNTALLRELVPAYFLSPYVGRYDDIWASYFLRKIMDHLGDTIRYGSPLVRQDRNVHNLWTDLEAERMGMQLTDGLIGFLREVTLASRTYGECFRELGAHLERDVVASELLGEVTSRHVSPVVDGMKIWLEAFSRLQE